MGSKPVILKCECCGFSQEFKSEREAFIEGWDSAPDFSMVELCPLCPLVCVIMKEHTHEKAHALWAKEGRPKEFTPEKCCQDGMWDNHTEIKRVKQAMKRLHRESKAATRNRKLLH